MVSKGKHTVKEPLRKDSLFKEDKSVRESPLPILQKESMRCGHFRNGRNLVVCIDGTSNQFGEKNTNVVELFRMILRESNDYDQEAFYSSGIGTYAEPSWKSLAYLQQIFYHKVDLAIAWGFDRTVQAAYEWLSVNYQKDDCIFLFGFSRGAFQVRAIAGMIYKVGLLAMGNRAQIPYAYALYRASEKSSRQATLAENFRKTFSHKDVKVHFVGAWDTVSSIGIVRGKRLLPATIDGMGHVCYFRHSLALDERRVKFLPEFAYGGSTKPPPSSENNERPKSPDRHPLNFSEITMDTRDDTGVGLSSIKVSEKNRPQTLEVWFAGTHSDVGGGNASNASMDRSRPPLRWMVFEAEAVGLRMAKFEREIRADEQIEIKESLTGMWWLFEIIPFGRLSFSRDRRNHSTHKPHLGASRKIHDGQKIHSSLLRADLATTAEYTPQARPPRDGSRFWNTLRTEDKFKSPWLELDLYEAAENAVTMFLNNQNSALREIAMSNEVSQAVYDALISALKSDRWSPDQKYRTMEIALEMFGGTLHNKDSLILASFSQVYKALSGILEDSKKDFKKTTELFLKSLTNPRIYVIHGDDDVILAVVFSPNGKQIVSGSSKGTIRLWDATTGDPIGEPLTGHDGGVNSVVFSADDKLLASGSHDKTVRIWNVETGVQVGPPFRGHTGNVWSVAFSPKTEDNLVISGSQDGTVRIWNIHTAEVVGKLQGQNWVYSVAVSHDGRYIASGSRDGTIRLWDVKKQVKVWHQLQGHSDLISCVAFSPDGNQIISASSDRTVRRWDVQKGDSCGTTLEVKGYDGQVHGFAISPKNKYIVLGSDDATIRIWDMEIGQQLGEPLRGHTNPVQSVAFSPDGKKVVSGSWGSVIQVWDAELAQISAEKWVGDEV
ncbi:WD40-repeat-containing domain protein [Crepidotus variabilis]|uniref:WD40-repeat-containing domain protein n=1 Tax=Crepidotus variabilis TaxID=179855 RepID=A0A9P6EBG0_9AGAR|nr:WD40-repeat-containing domain protein [Crepidotus variabilis]